MGDDANLSPAGLQRPRQASAVSRLSGSRVPKPSSINNDSTWVSLLDKEASPKARASDTRKLSPPEERLHAADLVAHIQIDSLQRQIGSGNSLQPVYRVPVH